MAAENCNSLRKNLYLCLQLNEMNISYKILLNNHDYFIKHGNKLDVKKFAQLMHCEVEIINAKNTKLNKNLLEFNENKYKHSNYLLDFIKEKKKKSKFLSQ